MAPPTHGPLFDEFPARAHDPHGAHQDENYGHHTAQTGKHGPLRDADYRQPVAQEGKHGAQMDEFAWTQVPAMHGQMFDTDFSQPAMLDGVDHGTWYDVFRGGATQVKYIYDGGDYEGVIVDVANGEVTVQTYGENNGGARHTIGLGQMKELARYNRLGAAQQDRHPVATPGHTPAPIKASGAEAPSAHSTEAHGGARTDAPDVGGVFANKSVDDTVDMLRKRASELE